MCVLDESNDDAKKSTSEAAGRPLRKFNVSNILKDGASLFSGDATTYEFTSMPGMCVYMPLY